MLTVYRSNRAEFLAELLAAQLRLEPPGPFEEVQVVVNTWPTSRWLGEQLAVGLGGIAANIRYPFPGSQLRRIVDALLVEPSPPEGSPLLGDDPWRANQLVWPVLELLPALIEHPEAEPLRQWLGRRGGPAAQLDLARWQLGRAIADAFDDYALYRPDQLAAWWHAPSGGKGGPGVEGGQPGWQPLLLRLLRDRLGVQPFGLKVLEAIERLRQGPPPSGALPSCLRLFGLSALAPIQVQLLQAISAHTAVDLYLLTPCRDLWQRCIDRRRLLSDTLALQQPLEGDWLLDAPGLEARFGRLGAEFQQLLEGTGESQLGQWQEKDLFFAPATAQAGAGPGHVPGPAPLLAQLQQQLVDPAEPMALQRPRGDHSLEFHPCPGRLRQVQIVRDRILQLLAADPSLQPRDVLVMTPQVDALAPLVASVFGDREATGVTLPWRLTDRSQQSETGISRTVLQLLNLAGERLTASGLEALLESAALQRHFELSGDETAALHRVLQQAGFRWGRDADERGGLASGSLSWAIDRLLLGLVLPASPGLAPAETAPLATGHSLDLLGRWLHLLGRLNHWLAVLRRPVPAPRWAGLLRAVLLDLFGDGGDQAWELPLVLAAIDSWQQAAASCELELGPAVVAAVLDERLAADSGRFGHRSGALTVSALEPMRAIPHRVIVLMGLDAGAFPRQRQRPGFHLLEQRRQLGDPNPSDQDRYVLLEALLSARDHLLITWSCRDERKGEALPPATPVRQWLAWLQGQLPCGGTGLVVEHPASPLDRANFEPGEERPAGSCDRRLLEARKLLEQPGSLVPPLPLAARSYPAGGEGEVIAEGVLLEPTAELRRWLMAPQAHWLADLGLRPREWADAIDDLDSPGLDERQRSALLRRSLEVDDAMAPDPDHASEASLEPSLDQGPSWQHRLRGQALLPPLAAGQLEAAALARRWAGLQAALAALGPERRQLAVWGPWQQELLWRGDAVLLLHTAKPRCRHHLDLWLALLLAAAAGQQPREAVLVARGDKGFGVQARIQPLGAAEAQAELTRLEALRQQWRQRCWPVPPETGWALLQGGEARAISTWEGGVQQRGERLEPEQALCFGAQLPGRALLDAGMAGPASELLAPLLERMA